MVFRILTRLFEIKPPTQCFGNSVAVLLVVHIVLLWKVLNRYRDRRSELMFVRAYVSAGLWTVATGSQTSDFRWSFCRNIAV